MTASIETRTTRRTRPDDPEPDGTARIPGELFLFRFFWRFLSAVVIVCRGGKMSRRRNWRRKKRLRETKYDIVQGVLPIISISVLKQHYITDSSSTKTHHINSSNIDLLTRKSVDGAFSFLPGINNFFTSSRSSPGRRL